MKKFLDIYVSIIISIGLIIFAYIFLREKYSLIIFLSFSLVIIITTFLMLICFKRKNSYFEAIMVTFYLLFFIVAPVIQLNSGRYPTTFPINVNMVLKANILNSIFLISYIIFRYIKLNKDKKIYDYGRYEDKDFTMNKITMSIMATIFMIYFIPNIRNIIYQIFNRVSDDNIDQVTHLIINKFILFIPLLFVYYFINRYKKNKNNKDLIFLFFWIIILIICKNPFNEKRNALGPIYLSILLFLIIKKNNVRNFLILTSITFIIIFPLSSIFTHSQYGMNYFFNNLKNSIDWSVIIQQFKELHFDAYANLNVAIEYVSIYGVFLWKQFIGAILFFIPRGLWNNKPISSGMLTGNYLMSNYGFHFNNIASPITAEGYYNFGIIGIIVFAFILSKWSKISYKWLNRNNYYSLIAWYMIIHLFFLMRGDLMNGIAYLIGPLSALYFMPKLIGNITNIILKIKK